MCEVITIDDDCEDECEIREIVCLAEQELATYPESFKRSLTEIIEPNSSKNEDFHRPSKVTLPKIRKYKCDICDTVLYCSNSLASHKRNLHEIAKIQECVLCSMVMYKAETWKYALENSSLVKGCPHEYWKDVNLPFDVAKMMDCSTEMFKSNLNDEKLPKCVETLMKDLRRKWKNKKAAQTSRKRK